MLGGTWDLFRYPGIRSDSSMETMGYTFKPWDGDKSISEGPRILEYINRCAREYQLEERIMCGHAVTSADFDSATATWNLDVDVTSEGGNDSPTTTTVPKIVRKSARTAPKLGKETADSPAPSSSNRGRAKSPNQTRSQRKRFSCSFVLMCTGYYDYSEGYTPEFQGRSSFKGEIIHPQLWPENYDYSGKRIVVIGSGATAITLIPSLADKAAHVTMLQRSPTYIASVPGKDPVVHLCRTLLPRWLADIAARWWGILFAVWAYWFSMFAPGVMKWALMKLAQKDLGKSSAYMNENFSPRYGPWEQRLCVVPDADFFHVIRDNKATVVTAAVKRFSAEGVVLEKKDENGEDAVLPADVIITATGLKLKLIGGISMSMDGVPLDFSKHLMYKGVMLSNVPNAAVSIGYTNNTWTLKCDLTFEYVTNLLNYMDQHHYKTVVPYRAAPKGDQNKDAGISSESIFNLTAGYVLRSVDILPRQGSEYPWVYHHNYLKDMQTLRFTHLLDDEVLRFK